MIFSVSIYPVYLSLDMVYFYHIQGRKKNFGRRKHWGKAYCLMHLITMRAGAISFFFPPVFYLQHEALCLAHGGAWWMFTEEWFRERQKSISQSVPVILSESGKFLFHRGSYGCGLSLPCLSPLPANHTTQAMDWKSQVPKSIYHHWTLLWERAWYPTAFQRQNILKSPMVNPNFIYV